MALLSLGGLTKTFGGLSAVKNLTLDVDSGSIVSLIGPNGAGKSTVFNLITGIYRPTAGCIVFDGRDISGSTPDAVAKAGITRTFQNIRLFAFMTVLENVLVGRHCRMRSNPWGDALHSRFERREETDARQRALDLLEWFGIARYASDWARNLPYGMQRRLEIARALASEPRLLLLDEPAAGTNPAEKAALMKLVQAIRDRGVTVLLIEHDMKVVMGLCETITVLHFGQRIAAGPPEQVRADPAVIEAYLGTGAAEHQRPA